MIEAFITAVRQSHPSIQHIYTNGSCYKFHLILNTVTPCIPYYDPIVGHVYSLINGCYYDINGKLDDEKVLSRLKTLDQHLSDYPHDNDPNTWC